MPRRRSRTLRRFIASPEAGILSPAMRRGGDAGRAPRLELRAPRALQGPTSILPLMCLLVCAPGGPETMIVPSLATVFGWHSEHLRKSNGLTFRCAGVLGGAPWHDPQKACETPRVHTGFRSLKLVSAANDWPPPWQ